jgi:methionyl aminopeptidase
MIRPGITTKMIDQVVEKTILANDATPSFKGYNGFPAATCCSVNDTLVHGFPSNTILKEGDIISVDIGACYKGYHGDSAWTYAVGNISEAAQHLLDVTKNSLFEGLKFAKAGNHLSDISHAIGEYVYAFGYSIPYEYSGHGIGSHLHEDPSIPNFGPAGKGIVLKEGMTLAIEPMVHRGKPYTKVMDDEWTVKTKDGSLAAHYEHTVLITSGECEILTTLKGGLNG